MTILLICFALLIMIFIPSYFGIRLGAAFATVLGVLSMLPITAMIFLPFFKSGAIHWGNVAGFHVPPHVHVSPTFIFAWFFPILWNVIAMEAAACYVGECRGGARDAKIALTAEGIFGMFIYIMTPLMFVAVLGILLTSADPLTLYLTYTDHIFGPGSWERWFVGIPLILALALSVLNAIMGVGRSLYQAAEDGLLPRWFAHKNRHGVPGNAMAFNVVCAAILVLLGSPLRIYIISNGGYLLSCCAGVRRLLHLPPPAPGRAAAVPAADVREVGRARDLHHLDGHLLLRRLELARRLWSGQPRAPGSICSGCSSSPCTRRCTGGGHGKTAG